MRAELIAYPIRPELIAYPITNQYAPISQSKQADRPTSPYQLLEHRIPVTNLLTNATRTFHNTTINIYHGAGTRNYGKGQTFLPFFRDSGEGSLVSTVKGRKLRR